MLTLLPLFYATSEFTGSYNERDEPKMPAAIPIGLLIAEMMDFFVSTTTYQEYFLPFHSMNFSFLFICQSCFSQK